jgi:hypothetical protein
MARSILGQEEAEAVTSEFSELYVSAHRHAQDVYWTEAMEAVPELVQAAGPATRASVLHDLITSHVEQRAPGCTRALGFFAHLITGDAGLVLVRFKMLDERLRPVNHPSGQQDLLSRHQFSQEAADQLTLEGMAELPTVLTCGYQLSPGEISMERVVIACHFGSDIVYWYQLATGGGQAALFLPGVPPPEPRIRSSREVADTGSE